MMCRTFPLRRRSLFSLVAVTALFPAGSRAAATHATADSVTTVRVVKVAREDVVPVRAKVRYSTLLVLPDNEEILDFTTGDREFWIINGAHNLCYVHPAQVGIRSNLNLITASGHVYSFLLTEISGEPNAQPDLKLFVEPKESSGAKSLEGYVRAGEVEAYKKELQTLREQTERRVRAAEAGLAEQVNRFRSEYAAKLRFDYKVDANAGREPFLVSAIYHDDAFTYLECAAREKPTLYEVKDGKPNLIQFQVENGVYIAPKIIDNGYLTVGKKKLAFARRTSVE
jgi:type IV secretion system protein VirB9